MNRVFLAGLIFVSQLFPSLVSAQEEGSSNDVVVNEPDTTPTPKAKRTPLYTPTPSPSPSASPTPDPFKDVATSGILASTVTSGGGSVQSFPQQSDPDIMGDKLPLISGGLSKSGERSWTATVNNSSQETLSVSVRIEQLGAKGNSVKSDSFTATIKPGASVTRTVTGAVTAVGGVLKLENFKRQKK